MSVKAALLGATLLLASAPACAHRLDEYLQATTLAVEKGRVEVEIRLAPGVAVFPAVFADIDGDADGAVSAAEQRAYAERVLGDLALAIDGTRLPLRLVSSTFAAKELLQEGLGEIRLWLEAALPGTAARRRLTFENHHYSGIGVYLVNALAPRDPDIHLGAQRRNPDQSFYRLDYADAGAPRGMLSSAFWPGAWRWMDSALIALAIGVALLCRRRIASRVQ